MRSDRITKFALAPVLGAVLAACTSLGATTTEPISSPSPAPVTESTTTLDIVGHSSCSIRSATDEGGRLSCRQESSDARLTGSALGEYHYADPSDSIVMWGTYALANDDGSWTCQWVGLRSPNALHAFDFACAGEDGYTGLWAYWHQLGDSDYSSLVGWIEPRK